MDIKTNISPETYGLHKRTQLRELGDKHLGIVKIIKSRIIRKDAQKIIEMAAQIQAVDPAIRVSLICTSNICSKSLVMLQEKGIEVKMERQA